MRQKLGLQTLLIGAAWFLSQNFNLIGVEGGGLKVEGMAHAHLAGKSRQSGWGDGCQSLVSSSATPSPKLTALSSTLATGALRPQPYTLDRPPFSVYRIKTIVLDAGHGGKDPGCHGAISEEKDNALAIILHLGDLIEANFPDIKVIYTRDSDVFIELNERAAIANRNKADLFVSVHCNSVSAPAISGAETYVMGLHTADHNLEVAKRENASIYLEKDYQKNYEGYDPNSPTAHILGSVQQSAYLEQSILFASLVQQHAKRIAARNDKGVKQAGFLVLRETAMPAVLVESGYLTNRSEEAYIASAQGQQQVGEAIFEAFVTYKAQMEGTPAAKTRKFTIRRPAPPKLKPAPEIETIEPPLVVENVAVDSRQLAAGSGQQAVGSRQLAAGSGQQAVGSRQGAKGKAQPATSNQQPVINPAIVGNPQRPVNVQPVNGQKSTVNSQRPPITNNQPTSQPANRATNNQPWRIFLLAWNTRLDRNTGQLSLLTDVQEQREGSEYRYYTGPFATRAEAEKMLPEIRNLGFRTAVIEPSK